MFSLIPKKIVLYIVAGLLLSGAVGLWVFSIYNRGRQYEKQKQFQATFNKAKKARKIAQHIDADATLGELLSSAFATDE